MFSIHNKANSLAIANDICYRFYWSYKPSFVAHRLFVCWAVHSLPQSATHAIIESYSNCGEDSKTSVRQLHRQLISVVVVLDNLALTSKKIGTTETFYQILFLHPCQVKNQVFGEKLCVKYGSLANFACFVPQPLIHNVCVPKSWPWPCHYPCPCVCYYQHVKLTGEFGLVDSCSQFWFGMSLSNVCNLLLLLHNIGNPT